MNPLISDPWNNYRYLCAVQTFDFTATWVIQAAATSNALLVPCLFWCFSFRPIPVKYLQSEMWQCAPHRGFCLWLPSCFSTRLMLGMDVTSTIGGRQTKHRNILQHMFRCGDTCIDLIDSCKCGDESFGHKENFWCCHDSGTCRLVKPGLPQIDTIQYNS